MHQQGQGDQHRLQGEGEEHADPAGAAAVIQLVLHGRGFLIPAVILQLLLLVSHRLLGGVVVLFLVSGQLEIQAMRLPLLLKFLDFFPAGLLQLLLQGGAVAFRSRGGRRPLGKNRGGFGGRFGGGRRRFRRRGDGRFHVIVQLHLPFHILDGRGGRVFGGLFCLGRRLLLRQLDDPGGAVGLFGGGRLDRLGRGRRDGGRLLPPCGNQGDRNGRQFLRPLHRLFGGGQRLPFVLPLLLLLLFSGKERENPFFRGSSSGSSHGPVTTGGRDSGAGRSATTAGAAGAAGAGSAGRDGAGTSRRCSFSRRASSKISSMS